MSLATGALTIMLGFAISGAASSAYEGLTGRRAAFRMLREPDLTALAAVPVVTLGAPYILARNMLQGSRARRNTAAEAFAATLAAGLWSLVIGGAALHAIW